MLFPVLVKKLKQQQQISKAIGCASEYFSQIVYVQKPEQNGSNSVKDLGY